MWKKSQSAVRAEGLVRRDLLEAVPLEQDPVRGEVDLLKDRILNRALAGAADGRQVRVGDHVAGEQRRPGG